MSLDDECPTQYFGADPVTFTAIGAGNGTVQMTQERARRLIAEGVPEYKFTGLLPAVEMRNAADEVCLRTTEEDTGHRQGCAFGRTARCTCMYLIQWDKTPAYTAPTYKQRILDEVAAAENLTREEYTDMVLAKFPVADALFDDKGEAEKLFKEPGHLQPAPFPMEERDYYPQVEKPLKALTVDGEIWEPRRLRLDEELKTRYWHKEFKDIRRRFIAMFGIALAGWAFSIARGVWGF